MKQKSLRQLAKELGVSHSYLSQVRNGKRPPSEKVVSKSGKQVVSIFAPEPSLTETGYVVPHTRKCYNLDVLGNRLEVGQRTLNP